MQTKGSRKDSRLPSDEGTAHPLSSGTCQVFGDLSQEGEKILRRQLQMRQDLVALGINTAVCISTIIYQSISVC